ncbi:hypothetical protein LTR94_034520, partial [Friedmanniomyces endolithicus]
MDHRAVAIVPSSNLDASEAFYRRLNFTVVSDYGHYRILEDGRGGHLHLTHLAGWPRNIEDNPFGRVVLNAILTELGHEAEFVSRGEVVAERLAQGGFDAVLMDL